MIQLGGGVVRAGVVDIGSNSVRLVVYDVFGAGALPRFNEKVMAGLGRDLGASGVLSPDGVIAALRALKRFRAVLDGLGVTQTAAVATAAVREAGDGADFAARASDALGQQVKILSGQDEARFSSLGVLRGVYAARGVSGDLGGSSVELSSVADGLVGATETHLLGPLAAGNSAQLDEKRVRKTIRAALAKTSVLTGQGGVFYAVGGAWRALAKLHMEITDYPLRLLHGYRMNPKALRATLKAALAKDPISQARRDAVASRRAATLPYAAVLLDEIMAAGRFSELWVSAYGLREGVLFDLVGPSSGEEALPSSIALAARLGPGQKRFGEALFGFVSNAVSPERELFDVADKTSQRIEAAACLLGDSGARLHPDHRAGLAYELALRGGFAGTDHAERAFIALAVGARYSRRFKPPKEIAPLLSPEAEQRARQLGACMRVGAVFSGGSAEVLADGALSIEDGHLQLVASKRREHMISESVERRLSQAADRLGLKSRVELI